MLNNTCLQMYISRTVMDTLLSYVVLSVSQHVLYLENEFVAV